jgi:hypothetical protein
MPGVGNRWLRLTTIRYFVGLPLLHHHLWGCVPVYDFWGKCVLERVASINATLIRAKQERC